MLKSARDALECRETMKLLTYTILVIVCVTLALITGIFVTAHLVLDPHIEKIEISAMTDDCDLVTDILQTELDGIAMLCRDYATWDDACSFVQDGHPAGHASDVALEIFGTARLDTILLYDAGGTLVYGTDIERSNMNLTSPSSALLTYLDDHDIYAQICSSRREVTGIIPLPEGPMMVSAAPVLRSTGQGPSQGMLLFGRYLRGDEVVRVQDITSLPVSFYSPDDPAAYAGIVGSGRTDGVESPVIAPSPDRKTVSGVTALDDIEGRPAVLARIDQPRSLYFQSIEPFFQFILVIVATCVSAGILILILLHRTLFRHFEEVSRTVAAIRHDRDYSRRLPRGLTDEMNMLCGAINDLLSFLEGHIAERNRYEECLRDSREKYRQLFHSANDIIFVMQDGHISDCNKKAREMLGYNPEDVKELSILDVSPDCQPDGRWSAEALKEYYAMAERGAVLCFEWRHLRKDGTFLDTEVALNRFDLKSGPYLLAIARDITEKKQTDRLKSEAFVRIEQNLQQFATLNDEIRNPLQVIQAVAEMHSSDDTAIVLEQVGRIDRLVDDLDRGYIASEKVREFLRKHYQFGKKE